MAQKDLTLRIKTVEKELNNTLKKIGKLETLVNKLSKAQIKIRADKAKKEIKAVVTEAQKGEAIVAKLFNPFRTDGFGRSIGKVRDQLSQVRAAFDAANSAADRQKRATALIAGNFKKIRMEAVAFAMASGDQKALNPGATGGNVKARLKEIQAFPKTILAGREAMGLLNRMLELAEVNSKDFLDINKAIGKQLKINADIQKAANEASGVNKKKSKKTDSEKKLEDEKKASQELERQKKIEEQRFKNALKNIRIRKRERKQQRQGRLLGAGFPLLFGGGIGAVGGSLAGSFLAKPGEEFGAQIFGSALGSQIEQLVRRANSLGEAIREISFEKLEEQSIIVSGQLRDQVELLKQIGQKEQARALVAQEVFKRTGATAEVNKDINRSVEVLNAGFSELVNSAGTTLAILGAPLLGAIGAVSFGVAQIFKLFNRGASTIRSLIEDLPIVDKFFEKFSKSLQKSAQESAEIQRNFRQIADKTFTERTIQEQKILGVRAQTFDGQRKNLEVERKLIIFKLRQEKAAALEDKGISFESDPKAFNEITRAFNEKFFLQMLGIEEKLFNIDEQEELRNKKLERRINLLNKENEIAKKIVSAQRSGDQDTANRLNFELQKISIQNKLGEDLRNAKSTEEEILLVKKAIADIDKLRITLSGQLTQEELKLKAVYDSIGSSIENGIVDAIQGAIDGTRTLGDVARSVFTQISRTLLQVGVNSFLGGLPGIGKFFKAEGGPVKRGGSFIVGERGPELFTPGVSGMITPNHALGGSTSIVVNVDASGSSVEGDEEQANAFGSAIATAIQSELIKQKRPGGLLA